MERYAAGQSFPTKFFGLCHSPVDFRAYSRAYPRLLPLTLAHADAQISTGE